MRYLNYRLVRLQVVDDRIKILYKWYCNESSKELYTCRPIKEFNNFDEYYNYTQRYINKGDRLYLLVNEEGHILGKVSLFDYNMRNHSAECGYYMPSENRSKGLGKVMIRLFLECIFNDKSLDIYKVYATTASCNISSYKLLEFFNFTLDGRLRAHYWISGEKYDQLHYSLLKNEWKV